ncbi:MAG TPA: hypothetical protein VIT68_04715, partial [Candidatus Gracilibacteria bacterium]
MEQSYIYAINQNYKACITSLQMKEEKIQYEICIYRWNEEKFDDEGKNLWERIAGPFVGDGEAQAQIVAKEQLALFTGEILDERVSPALQQETEIILGHQNFLFLNPESFEITYLKENGETQKLEGEILLATQELYVAKFQKEWFVGFLAKDFEIQCFICKKNLKEALQDINKTS